MADHVNILDSLDWDAAMARHVEMVGPAVDPVPDLPADVPEPAAGADIPAALADFPRHAAEAADSKESDK